MPLRWKSAFVALFAALTALVPSTGAVAADSAGSGEVTIPDPVRHNCYYVVGWYFNLQDLKRTNVYSYGYCTS